jgi:hypothetical protein
VIEPDRPDEAAGALGDDQLGIAQAAADLDDLTDVALPRLRRQVASEDHVDVAEQPANLVELARPRVT